MKSTLWINPRYSQLKDFVTQLPEVMDNQGTYIYGGRRNLIKMFVAPDGTQLNVKRFCKPSFLNNIVYSTGIRKPKGWRAFTYPTLLLEKGIETPEAVAYIEERNALGLLGKSYFVSLQCTYSHLLYEVGNASEGTYEQLAIALAHFAADMHEKGVLHLDFSPGNILWEKDDNATGQTAPEDYHFSIVDINRMHFGSVSMRDGCKSFARLWGPKRFITLIIEEYARLRQFDTSECLAITMKARQHFWHHYMKKREMEFNLEL